MGSPLFFHVSSTNSSNPGQVPASIDDNLGGPDGKIGAFAFYASSLTPNNTSAVAPGSPTVVTYNHTITNIGTLADHYNLKVASSQGLRVDIYDSTGVTLIATDTTGDGIWEFVNAAFDSDANNQPDSPVLASGATFAFKIKLTAATGVSDILDTTVIRLLSINNAVCNSVNIVTATDITAIGNLTLQTSPQGKSVVAGQVVDYGLKLRNFALSDKFDLKPVSSLGWQVQLYTDPNGDGNPADGVLVATDVNGNGVFTDAGDSIVGGFDSNANGKPDFGTLANGGNQTFVVRLTAPAAAPLGAVDTTSVLALGATNGANATAVLTTTVRSKLTFTPSYTIAAGTNKFSGPNSSVFYGHILINSWSAADSVTLSGSSSNGYTVRYYTDPNGDGNPSDGLPITAPVALAANGGFLQLVVEVVIPILTPPVTDTATITATSTVAPIAPASVVTDQVKISFVSVYTDALRTLSFGNYTRCQTVYTKGSSLTPGTTTTYQMRYRNPGAVLVRSQTISTDGNGDAVDQYTFTAADPVGTWTVQLFNLSSATVVDSATLTLENFAASTIAPVSTGKASYAVSGDNLNISARFNNTNIAAPDTATTFRYVVLNAGNTQYLTAAGTFAPYSAGLYSHTTASASVPAGGSFNDSFTISGVLFPAAGTYHINVDWVTSCGAVIATASYSFPVGSSLNSFSDAAFSQPSDLFGISGTVYLRSPNLLVSTGYKVAWYRPDGTLVLTQSLSSDGTGLLTTNSTTAALGVSGLWHVVVYPATATPPATYNPGDPAGASSDSFTLDLIAPLAPLITGPVNGSSTTNTTPTLSGTAEAGSTVTLTITGPGGPYTVITTADASGNYSVPAPALTPGAYSVTATARDAAGNVSATSGTTNFNVVFGAPVITAPVTAGATSVSGTSTAADGTLITIYKNGVAIGTTTVTGGTWTLTGVSGLQGGETLTATAGTGAGTSALSSGVIVIPAAPAITGPLVSGQTSVSGTSTAPVGSTITVYVNGVPYTTTVQAGGTWTVTVPPLTVGAIVNSTATAGGQTSASSGSQTVINQSPVVTGPIYPTDSTISGTSAAAAGTPISVYQNGVLLGTTTVQAGGVWTLSGVSGLTGGASITATAGTGAVTSLNSGAVIVAPLPGLLRTPQATLSPTSGSFPRAPGDPSLARANLVVTLYNPGTSYPQESTDYSDQTTAIVFFQLEANSGNTLRVNKDTINGKLVINY